jgi:hypothetical protein
MNSHGESKPEPADADQTMRLLELELAQRRAALKNARSPYRGFRLASFVFLFAVLLGVVLALYYVFYSGSLDDFRTRRESTPKAAPSTQAP